MDPNEVMERMQISKEIYCQSLIDSLPWMNDQFKALSQANGDLSHLGAAAHAIKGASGNLGIQRVYQIAARLESIARGRAQGDVQEVFAQLDQAMNEAQVYIDQYLASADHLGHHAGIDPSSQPPVGESS